MVDRIGTVEDLVTDAVARSPLTTILERTYQDRRVLVTGHNGFVGSWLSYVMSRAGAQVFGLALAPTDGALGTALDINSWTESTEGDIRDMTSIRETMRESSPEIVFHLAAQPLVRESFADPLGTLQTNAMGTAHLLEALRSQSGVKACVVVTSDKCYTTGPVAHSEDDALGGDDPYSASKAAAELVTHAFRDSFFRAGEVGIGTARAGNIVGGGDMALDRIIPDCIRAVAASQPVDLRYPSAIRPWQHVLDAVGGYLRLGDALATDGTRFGGPWNFGPPADAVATVREVVEILGKELEILTGNEALSVSYDAAAQVLPERAFLTLSSTKAAKFLGWSQLLDLTATLRWTARWYHDAGYLDGGHPARSREATEVTAQQMDDFLDIDERACRASAAMIGTR